MTVVDDVGDSVSSPFQPLAGGLTCGTRGLAIAAGPHHALVVTEQRKVQAWGSNSSTQLGRGEPVHRAVTGLTGVTAVESGDHHVVALKEDGTVWTWGDNVYGQLGTDPWLSISSRATPMRVPGLTDVRAVSAGVFHTLALRRDGTVWGLGEYGQPKTPGKPRKPRQVRVSPH